MLYFLLVESKGGVSIMANKPNSVPVEDPSGLAVRLVRGYSNLADLETSEWLLSKSAWVLVGILSTYFLTIFIILPQLMTIFPRMRKERMIMYFIWAYNSFMLLLNGTLTFYFIYCGIVGRVSPICAPIEVEDEGVHHSLAVGMWGYTLIKIFELCDTVIMILRRPGGAPLVHVYHHSTMLMLAWVGLRYLPGGTTMILALFNTMTHLTIFLYYHFAAFHWLNTDRIVHFRKATVVCQLVQFGGVGIVCVTGFVCNCGYPRLILGFMIAYVCSILLVFFISYSSSKTPNSPQTPTQTQEFIKTAPANSPTVSRDVNNNNATATTSSSTESLNY